MLKKTYKTNRLFLVQPNVNMASEIVDFYSRNKEFFEEFDPQRPDVFYKINTHKDIIRRELEEVKQKRMLKFWIYKIEDKKRIIGMINFSNIVMGVFLSCTVGYKLDEFEQNKGYMTEALHAAIIIAFKELRLHRIEANIMPHNKPSLELAKRLGFEYEGLAKKYLKINGKWEDHVHMTIINDEV
ncbi:GNAT family N-acetyltransferase [Brachyspira hyodysenteriae]|uniref:GNAT family N-acetyltransferase n=1 Tax=Brachyspira hyodysenteriae TaxID=159 RepID=UPI00063DD885|nr:GNAT family N-acetyltransferase [Brachyspira hyodysenteriae]KLI20952.1 alanine acetyltransferase [Brachyspira hyodysenteriae]KLI21866.1 alanine acetyltransferase [Brachyspira hyodysenteriae]KLI36408.1 alanine acetyltransferase [Brachyspira hyodysenteriae]MCZ9893418.1 GNAT family N-acetyltransferase [Brachyspira hyodysenteriae]MCZ9957388.1 GNAT family N-acetyltransferase [Brachyspira hyodysenteriae]